MFVSVEAIFFPSSFVTGWAIHHHSQLYSRRQCAEDSDRIWYVLTSPGAEKALYDWSGNLLTHARTHAHTHAHTLSFKKCSMISTISY